MRSASLSSRRYFLLGGEYYAYLIGRSSGLPIWTAQGYLQVDRNSCWMTVQSAWCEAILANRPQNVMVQHRTERTNDLQISWLSGHVDSHLDDCFSINVETGCE